MRRPDSFLPRQLSRLRYLKEGSTAWLGIGDDTTSHTEKLVSGLGALLGLAAVGLISHWYLGPLGASLMAASMGATAVLLFAVPHGALSQPWAVIAGHAVSALIGVGCQQLFPGELLTPALAVGLAVATMHYLRCIHPPGGATALAAVIGGSEVHALGFNYLITPVMLNVATILAVALLFNGLFPWRRYPAHLALRRGHSAESGKGREGPTVTHEDFAHAMEQLNSYIDVTSEDLAELFALAMEHARQQEEHPQAILAGGFYSNGQSGRYWAVRQVIDFPDNPQAGNSQLIYKNVAGAGAYSTGICSIEDFRAWARFPVQQSGHRWIRIGTQESQPLAENPPPGDRP